jgi:hypothetical protein
MQPNKFDPKPAQVRTVEQTKVTPSLLEDIAEHTQRRYDAGRFAPKDEDALWRLAETWYWSMLLPSAYYPQEERARYSKEWADRGISRAVIVMRYGASLGVLPEIAIRQIYIVEGQPSPAASLMLALAFSSGVLKRQDWRIVKSDATECQIELFATSRLKPEVVTAKFDEYKHLHSKTNWKNYPQDMLVARATSRAMRRYFPDQFGGVYAAEERVDFKADRAAGYYEDSTDRILAAVDVPQETVVTTPVAHTEPTQEAPPMPAKPARTKADFDALMARVKGASDAITPDDIVVLRAEIDLWADDPKNHAHFVRAWQQNGALNPAQVAP